MGNLPVQFSTVRWWKCSNTTEDKVVIKEIQVKLNLTLKLGCWSYGWLSTSHWLVAQVPFNFTPEQKQRQQQEGDTTNNCLKGQSSEVGCYRSYTLRQFKGSTESN